jgi:hypothetical protein
VVVFAAVVVLVVVGGTVSSGSSTVVESVVCNLTVLLNVFQAVYVQCSYYSAVACCRLCQAATALVHLCALYSSTAAVVADNTLHTSLYCYTATHNTAQRARTMSAHSVATRLRASEQTQPSLHCSRH